MNDEHHETILPSRHDALKTIATDCKLLKVEQKWKTKEKEKKNTHVNFSNLSLRNNLLSLHQ